MSFIQTHTHTEPLREIYVCVTLFKSPASVKLNLGIIIGSRTAESHLSAPAPSPAPTDTQGWGVTARPGSGGLAERTVLRCVRDGREMTRRGGAGGRGNDRSHTRGDASRGTLGGDQGKTFLFAGQMFDPQLTQLVSI